MYHTLYPPLCAFTLQLPCIFLISMYQPILPCFRKRLTIHQFNVQTATAENEEQDTLNNIISIQFQNCDFFL